LEFLWSFEFGASRFQVLSKPTRGPRLPAKTL
jgi:hypothetical protein